MPMYAQSWDLSRSESVSLLMYGREEAVEMGVKEKWSASRAVKVVSLANETNIRADRVDKRRARRGRRARGRVERKGG